MTSLSPRYFEEENRKLREKESRFSDWCQENGKTSLKDWMKTNHVLSQDLFAAKLVDYPDPRYKVASLKNEPFLSDLGKKSIATLPEFESSHLEYSLAYILDEKLLLREVASHLSKSEALRREDFKREYFFINGYEAPRLDSELPFEERSFISGPFCDLKLSAQFTPEEKSNYFCQWCGTFLQSKPRLQLAKEILCFKCARLGYLRLKPLELKINNTRESLCQKRTSDILKWERQLYVHNKRKGFLTQLNEFMGGNPDEYEEKFLKSHPKPEPLTYRQVGVNLKVVKHLDTSRYPSTSKEIILRDQSKCQLCEMEITDNKRNPFKVHYVIPKARGGKRTPANLVLLCVGCEDSIDWLGHRFKDNYWSCEPQWFYMISPDLFSETDGYIDNNWEVYFRLLG